MFGAMRERTRKHELRVRERQCACGCEQWFPLYAELPGGETLRSSQGAERLYATHQCAWKVAKRRQLASKRAEGR